MTTINVQPQSIPLDLSSFALSSSQIIPSISNFHPALYSLVELQKQYQTFGVDSSYSSSERNNNFAPIQVDSSGSSSSSTKSDTDSIASPPHRNNVIVKADFKRKKELVKDNAYWERRKKNNDAAKRSRDHRRMKEDEIASRAACLEQDNIRLRSELEQLRNETEALRSIIVNTSASQQLNIKVPVAIRPSSTVTSSSNLLTTIPPSVITSSNAQMHIQYPDSTHRSTVLVTNYSSST
ncbi:unnamed protein product [Auanema sp. JU1783]|nr:unnamed protein product [Auanema sp. JU1783]